MRRVAEIPICSVKVFDRLPINPRTLALVDWLRAGGDVPAIHVVPTGKGQFRVLDGRHRYLASRLMGRKFIKARYSTKLNRRVH